MIANALSKGDRCIRGGAAAPQVKGASRLRWHGEKKTSLWQRSGKAITTVLRRASICEGLITDSLLACGGIGVGESQAYSRHCSIHSRRYQTPLSTSFTLCNALPHAAIGQSAAVLWLQSRRNNHGFRKPTAPVPDWLSHTHAVQSTAHFLCPSLALPLAPSLRRASGKYGRAPASDHGWLKRLIYGDESHHH